MQSTLRNRRHHSLRSVLLTNRTGRVYCLSSELGMWDWMSSDLVSSHIRVSFNVRKGKYAKMSNTFFSFLFCAEPDILLSRSYVRKYTHFSNYCKPMWHLAVRTFTACRTFYIRPDPFPVPMSVRVRYDPYLWWSRFYTEHSCKWWERFQNDRKDLDVLSDASSYLVWHTGTSSCTSYQAFRCRISSDGDFSQCGFDVLQ